jgi:hypothetical protein
MSKKDTFKFFETVCEDKVMSFPCKKYYTRKPLDIGSVLSV